jgi:hypothetical protein
MPTKAAAAAAAAATVEEEEVWPFGRDEFHVCTSPSRSPLVQTTAFLTVEETKCTLCVAQC